MYAPATTSNKKSLDLALVMEEVQKYDCLYNKFSAQYRKQAQEKRLLESKWGKIRPESRSGRGKI